jgi:hypothetical protein
MSSNPAINLLRMFCTCGDASNVMDDQLNARRHYDGSTTDMDFDEVSVYEEVGDAKYTVGAMATESPCPNKVSKMMPSPISVFSYPFEDDSDSTEEDDDDEDAYWGSLPYMSSAFAVSKDEFAVSNTPTLRLAPRTTTTTTGHPLIGRSSSGTTATTIAMTTSMSGLSAAENFYHYPDVRDEDELFDDVDFDISSSLSTEIVQNPNPRRREYLDAVFRETTNNTKSIRRSSKSMAQDQEEYYKPQLIRMSQENYVHSPSIYPGDREKVFVQRGHSTVQPLIQH